MVARFDLDVDEKRVLFVMGGLLSRSHESSVDFQTLMHAMQSQMLDEGVLSTPEELPRLLKGWLWILKDQEWVENRGGDVWGLSHGGWTIWGAWRPSSRPSR
jgi:hypothetical protein